VIAVDSSAIVAVLLDEPEAPRIARLLLDSPLLLIGAPTVFELTMVMRGIGGPARAATALAMVSGEPFRLVPFDERHLTAAHDAFARFGKGIHPARLNFGDCMAYAVAQVAGCPLLYKGQDFARTDIASALG